MVAASSSLYFPRAVVVHPDTGDLFIVEAQNNRIRWLVKATGRIFTIAGEFFCCCLTIDNKQIDICFHLNRHGYRHHHSDGRQRRRRGGALRGVQRAGRHVRRHGRRAVRGGPEQLQGARHVVRVAHLPAHRAALQSADKPAERTAHWPTHPPTNCSANASAHPAADQSTLHATERPALTFTVDAAVKQTVVSAQQQAHHAHRPAEQPTHTANWTALVSTVQIAL